MKITTLNRIAQEVCVMHYGDNVNPQNIRLEYYFAIQYPNYENYLYPSGVFDRNIQLMLACGQIILRNNELAEVYLTYINDYQVFFATTLQDDEVTAHYDWKEKKCIIKN